MATKISKLYRSGEEFVPISIAEAVVVNTTDIPGLSQLNLGIVTLDTVINSLVQIDAINASSVDILRKNIDQIQAGQGIIIDIQKQDDGSKKTIISADPNFQEKYQLYEILPDSELPSPGPTFVNKIWLLLNTNYPESNTCDEYICYLKDNQYIWEKIGSITSELNFNQLLSELKQDITNLTTRVTNLENGRITANIVLHSDNTPVTIEWEIPNDLYDTNS